MGCGSSSLKGESSAEVNDINDVAPKPIKKVATNFSHIDYESTTSGRRDTVYAPHDAIRQKSDALPPLTEKEINPLDSTLGSTTADKPTAGSLQPLTTYSEGLAFGNAISEHPQFPLGNNAAHQAPYQDVTLPPTTPGAVQHIDGQFNHSSPATTHAAEKILQ